MHELARGGWTVAVLGLGAWLAGCAGAPQQLQTAAAHDLRCDEVKMVEIADGRYAAHGCGRGAVYARVCGPEGCHWGRLRHGHEEEMALRGLARPASKAPAREVIPAPPPASREVLPAPDPAPGAPPSPAPSAPPDPVPDAAVEPAPEAVEP